MNDYNMTMNCWWLMFVDACFISFCFVARSGHRRMTWPLLQVGARSSWMVLRARCQSWAEMERKRESTWSNFEIVSNTSKDIRYYKHLEDKLWIKSTTPIMLISSSSWKRNQSLFAIHWQVHMLQRRVTTSPSSVRWHCRDHEDMSHEDNIVQASMDMWHVHVFCLALSGLDQETVERERYALCRWYCIDRVFCPFRSGRECASLQRSTMWLQNCGLNLRITWRPANTTVVRRMSTTHDFFHSIFIAHRSTQCVTGVVSWFIYVSFVLPFKGSLSHHCWKCWHFLRMHRMLWTGWMWTIWPLALMMKWNDWAWITSTFWSFPFLPWTSWGRQDCFAAVAHMFEF